jgi:hypothetical protein
MSVCQFFLGGGFGPCSFHLDFWYVLIKIYLGNPYTVGKLMFRSFIWVSPFFTCFSFWRKYLVLQNRLNSVGWVVFAPLLKQRAYPQNLGEMLWVCPSAVSVYPGTP